MAQPSSPTRTLPGIAVPALFYGTAWKEERTGALTTAALRAGFRAVDTANQRRHYVEAAVGEAVAALVADGTLTRADLFLQTKFTHLDGQDHRLPYDPGADPATQVAQSFHSSLEHLGTSYIDSYILHGPSLRDRLADDDWQVWRAMEALQRAAKTRFIGISNVSYAQLVALMEGSAIKPAFVQNRCFARSGWDRQIREFCRAHGIAYQGFSLLTANRKELADPAVARIVARSGRSLPEVLFRFALAVGIIPLTGTSDPVHMRQDLACADLALSDGDIDSIEHVARA